MAVSSDLPKIIVTNDSTFNPSRHSPSKEDRMQFLVSKHPYLLFRRPNPSSDSGSSSPVSSTSSDDDITASSIDALLAAELNSPTCPDATKAWIQTALGADAIAGFKTREVGFRELCVEPSPSDSTDSFQSLMSAVDGLFGDDDMPEFGPSTMEGRWPYMFKYGDAAFAKGGNGQWRSVVVHEGAFDDKRKCLSYSAEWINPEGFPCRGTFYPTLGEIKPDCPYVRELIQKEKIELQDAGRDVEQNNIKALL